MIPLPFLSLRFRLTRAPSSLFRRETQKSPPRLSTSHSPPPVSPRGFGWRHLTRLSTTSPPTSRRRHTDLPSAGVRNRPDRSEPVFVVSVPILPGTGRPRLESLPPSCSYVPARGNEWLGSRGSRTRLDLFISLTAQNEGTAYL